MKRFNFFLISISAFLFCMSGPAAAKEADLPDVTVDGLHRVPDSKMAIVYAEPGADLAQYNRILLLDAYVAFKKNWERDQRSSSIASSTVTPKDVEKIKANLAQEFHTIFKKVLEDGGYEVVDEAAEDTLLLRPAIINLDVNAPDTPRSGGTYSITSSAGEMTLYVELYDSITGDLIAKAMDRRVDNNAYYTWSNSVTNRRAAEKILTGWAGILLDALNEAKQP